MHNTHTFPKNCRIIDKPGFDAVFKKRKKKSNSSFVVYFKKNNSDYPRLGMIAAKKQLRFAVQRNRVKRIIKEVFRHQQKELIGLDIVIVCLKASGLKSRAELRLCLEQLLNV